MTPDVARELIDAWNTGWCVPVKPDPTPLGQLRAAWAEASEVERAIFKDEISQRTGGPR